MAKSPKAWVRAWYPGAECRLIRGECKYGIYHGDTLLASDPNAFHAWNSVKRKIERGEA